MQGAVPGPPPDGPPIARSHATLVGVAVLPESAVAVIESGALAHLVTIGAGGVPQVSCVWVGMDGDEIVCAHLNGAQQKLKNVARDSRVALSIEAETANEIGMRHYLVVHGHARITEGGAPEWLQHLARTYVGPDAVFPPMPDPPPGFKLHITVDRVGGLGPWTA
jgi:PPOX class probable F420-dependent enzyme